MVKSLAKVLILYHFSNEINASKKPIIDFKKFDFKSSSLDLQIYNSTIGLVKNYNYVAANQFERSDKMIYNYDRNQFLSGSSTLLPDPLAKRNSDSFNPYGVSTIGETFALGLINTILFKNYINLQHKLNSF